MTPIPPELRTYADELPDPDETPALIRATVAGLVVLFFVALGMAWWTGR